MKNLTVRNMLILSLGAILLMTALMVLVAVKSLYDSNKRFHNFVEGVNARQGMTHTLREAVDLRAIAARNMVLVSSNKDLQHEYKIVQKAHAHTTDSLAKLKILGETASKEVNALIDEIDRIEQKYAPVALGIVDLALEGKREEAIRRIDRDCRPLLEALIEVTDRYSEVASRDVNSAITAADARASSQRNWLMGVCVIVMLTTFAAGVMIMRNILGALGAEPYILSEAVKKVSQGDLTAPLEVRSGDEHSVMAALHQMQVSLANVVQSVRQGSESVSMASSGISQGNNDLSERTENQANALEETSEALEKLSSTVTQNSENAKSANQLAQSASEIATQGGNAVAEVVVTMKEINASSKQITDIINVIDEIAFQTNILALNAAVEAARAGEHGRGFAVVANEVRSLAIRSADAAKDIKSLIDASVNRVDQGSLLVDQAGETMSEIVSAIRRVTALMGEISTATDAQNEGVHQVVKAMTHMDNSTQQNAALVDQMVTAASSLKSEASDLVGTVSLFKLVPIDNRTTVANASGAQSI